MEFGISYTTADRGIWNLDSRIPLLTEVYGILIDQLMNSIVIYDHEDDYHKVNDDIHRDTYVDPVIRVFSIYT